MQLGIGNEATFNLVETNQFKALTHLSLKFKQGNDEAIKKYLSGKLKDAKESIEQLRTSLGSFEENYTKSSCDNQQLMMDL